MNTRMDKYKNNNENIPTRSDKNKELYRQIYNAYDNFENLIVPSNAREITKNELEKEITTRSEYHKKKDIETFGNINNSVIRKEKVKEQQKEENEIYDIKELMKKAIDEKGKNDVTVDYISNDNYLKKLKLDNTKTNIEQIKEEFNSIQENDDSINDESLLKTANLSLEILSDLKSDNDDTMISPPIKDEELPDNDEDFYSNNYKFNKRDFEDKKYEEVNEEDDEGKDETSGNYFFKIVLFIIGILLIIGVAIYLINYFNRV